MKNIDIIFGKRYICLYANRKLYPNWKSLKNLWKCHVFFRHFSKRGVKTVISVGSLFPRPVCSIPDFGSWHNWSPTWMGKRVLRRPATDLNSEYSGVNFWAIFWSHHALLLLCQPLVHWDWSFFTGLLGYLSFLPAMILKKQWGFSRVPFHIGTSAFLTLVSAHQPTM